jgi:hypothetical protein
MEFSPGNLGGSWQTWVQARSIAWTHITESGARYGDASAGSGMRFKRLHLNAPGRSPFPFEFPLIRIANQSRAPSRFPLPRAKQLRSVAALSYFQLENGTKPALAL